MHRIVRRERQGRSWAEVRSYAAETLPAKLPSSKGRVINYTEHEFSASVACAEGLRQHLQMCEQAVAQVHGEPFADPRARLYVSGDGDGA